MHGAKPRTVDQARALFDIVQPGRRGTIEPWLAAAGQLPLITGWDTAGHDPVAKLYINLSDASAATRQRVCEAVIGPVDLVPAVIITGPTRSSATRTAATESPNRSYSS